MSTIQEDFQALFAQEADIRLGTIAELVLRIEHTGADAEAINALFREVHTLKGSAAVVGFEGVSRVAHVVEHHLDNVRSGRCGVTPELVDALLKGVDTLTELIAHAVAGVDFTSEAAEAETTLTAALAAAVLAEPSPPAPSPPAPSPPAASPPAPSPPAADVAVPAPLAGPASGRPAGGGAVLVPIERLDELVRLVGETASAQLRLGRVLATSSGVEPGTIAEFAELSRTLNELQERTMRTRMVPVATITDQLKRTVRDLARSLDKVVEWEVRGGDTELDRGVLHELSDSLIHLVRNAVDHGIEGPDEREAAGKPRQATIRLHAMQLGSEVTIAVTDDGRGIDVDRVRAQAARQGVESGDLTDEDAMQLVFRSGLSTSPFVTDISGRGVGLDVVRTSVESVRGRIEVRTERGSGTEFRIVVPITLAVLPCLLVEAGNQRFALPLHSVVLVQPEHRATEGHVEGRPAVLIEGRPVPITDLSGLLGLPAVEGAAYIAVLAAKGQRHAFRIDVLIGQRDVVVKGMGRLIPRIGVIAGASVEPDGSILVVLDPLGLVERVRQTKGASIAAGAVTPAEHDPRREADVLVVDDALTVRELQRTILERAGFRVRVACDGMEALALLSERRSDIVLTDVQMPRMDGFALTEAIRARPALANVPVLILTSLSSDADRMRGLDAGADGYIVKSAFDEHGLLTAIDRLLGDRS